MINEPPLLTIREKFPRPPAKLVAALGKTPTCFLGDAMNGRGALDWRIHAVDPKHVRFAGVAVTCACGPSDNLAVFGALAVCRKGDVVVAAADGFTTTALAGDLLLGMLKNKGAAAFVTDGMVRDINDIEALGLPVFARGITPNSCNKSGPGTVGLPVDIGGVRIESGDILVGDRDGVVVVPQSAFGAIESKLKEVRAAEADLAAKVKAGLTLPDSMRELLAGPRCERVD
jgi:4-hydroxy-4-methyl-2-oxoglutarate aldolase